MLHTYFITFTLQGESNLKSHTVCSQQKDSSSVQVTNIRQEDSHMRPGRDPHWNVLFFLSLYDFRINSAIETQPARCHAKVLLINQYFINFILTRIAQRYKEREMK
jgi:hypothetical protein